MGSIHVCIYIYINISLSLCLSSYLSVYLSIYLSTYLSIYRSIDRSFFYIHPWVWRDNAQRDIFYTRSQVAWFSSSHDDLTGWPERHNFHWQDRIWVWKRYGTAYRSIYTLYEAWLRLHVYDCMKRGWDCSHPRQECYSCAYHSNHVQYLLSVKEVCEEDFGALNSYTK